MARLLGYPVFKATKPDGTPYAGGKLHTYLTGTTTPAVTYQNAGLSVAHANPIILDSNGEATIYPEDTTVYTLKLTDSLDVEIWTKDGVGADSLSSSVTGILMASGAKILSGSGSPEGVYTAPVGSMFLRTDGGAGTTIYAKESGTGNTGWSGL